LPESIDNKRLLVFYVSAYGATKAMAEAIVEGANEVGVDATTLDIVGVDMALILDEIEAADGMAVGSCTINGDALEHAWALLSSLATIKVKKKVGAAFGSYGWSGEGPKMINERMKGLKFNVPLDPLRVQLMPTNEDLTECMEFGKNIAALL
jgi:flavorubredoxin